MLRRASKTGKGSIHIQMTRIRHVASNNRTAEEMNMVKPVNKPRCIIKIHKIGFAIFAKPRIKDQW